MVLPAVSHFLTGALSGLAFSGFGALKDSPHEGFHPDRFMKGPAMGAIEGALLGYLMPNAGAPGLFFSTFVLLRLTQEVCKMNRAGRNNLSTHFKYVASRLGRRWEK